jgi:hypothetical protein
MLRLNIPTDILNLNRIVLRLDRDKQLTFTTWSDILSCPLEELDNDKLSEYQFLCLYNDNYFVSTIKFDESFGHYVDPKNNSGCIEVIMLDNLWLIGNREI